MLRLIFCFSCCRTPDGAYKRSIRTTVTRRNEKLTEVANFNDMISDIKQDLAEQQEQREKRADSIEKQPVSSTLGYNNDHAREIDNANVDPTLASSRPIDITSATINEEVPCESYRSTSEDSEASLKRAIADDNLNNREEIERIKEYTRLDYTPITDTDSTSSIQEESSNEKALEQDNHSSLNDDGTSKINKEEKEDNSNNKNSDDVSESVVDGEENEKEPESAKDLLPNIDETNLDEATRTESIAVDEPLAIATEAPSVIQQVAVSKPPRPSTEANQQQQQQQQQQEATSHAALGSPLSNSTSSLISSFGSVSIQSHLGSRSSRMSWMDNTINNGDSIDDLEENQQQLMMDGSINYDHEFICSRLDEIFNQQMSLLNINANQLAYENVAIIIAYDKVDPKNNNRLICFATSKSGGIRSDDLHLNSLIDLRAATMARRALLSYLYKEIEIINANNSAQGKVLSQDAYLLERAYKMRQPAGYKLKKNIGLSIYLNRIESSQYVAQPPSRSSSRASTNQTLDSQADNSSAPAADQASIRPDEQPSILRLKSIDHKISLWNVLGLQGSILGMMIEPIYLDHIILGQVDDLKRLKTLQSKCAKSSLSAHANKPYRLACPKLLLWRDNCQSIYKTMATTTGDQDQFNSGRQAHNSLNWTYHDYIDDQAAELIEIKTGTVKLAYPNKENTVDTIEGGVNQIGDSRLCKSQMMQRLIRIMTNTSSCPFLFDGHNGTRFFDKIEPGTRVTYRALKNLAFQYNYVKYLCSPIFINDLRVAAGGIDWVNSYDKVKNYEDQIICKVPFAQLPAQSPSSLQLIDVTNILNTAGTSATTTGRGNVAVVVPGSDLMNNDNDKLTFQEQSTMKLKSSNSNDDNQNNDNNDKNEMSDNDGQMVGGQLDSTTINEDLQGEELDIPNPMATRPLRSMDNSLPDLSNRLFLASQSSTMSSPVSMEASSRVTPTPSEISSTKSKSKSKAKSLLKKLKLGKKKKKSASDNQLDEPITLDKEEATEKPAS